MELGRSCLVAWRLGGGVACGEGRAAGELVELDIRTGGSPMSYSKSKLNR